MTKSLATVDVETGEILEKGQRSDDEWESYIRSASSEAAIIERGVRWLQFYEDCQRNHGKRGGSRFSEFALARFGYSQPVVSTWVSIGRGAGELISNANKFAPDYFAMYQFTRLPDDAKQALIDSGTQIDRKAIKAVQPKKHLLNAEWREHVAQVDDDLEANIVLGDFRETCADLADESVDLVFCDPPYDRASVGLYADAAKAAVRVLRPGGSFMAYGGQYLLPGILSGCADAGLRFWWVNALLHGGQKARMTEYGIVVHWKPLVWFVKGTRGDKHTFIDDITLGEREKDTHEWQQSVSEAEHYIARLSSPRGLVVDFFCGGGTTALAADRLGRAWKTYEVDPLTRDSAIGRIQLDRAERAMRVA